MSEAWCSVPGARCSVLSGQWSVPIPITDYFPLFRIAAAAALRAMANLWPVPRPAASITRRLRSAWDVRRNLQGFSARAGAGNSEWFEGGPAQFREDLRGQGEYARSWWPGCEQRGVGGTFRRTVRSGRFHGVRGVVEGSTMEYRNPAQM